MPSLPRDQDRQLARYIVEWLCDRNAGQLRPAIEAMTVADYNLMHDELAYILLHGGHPPNWTKPEGDERDRRARDIANDRGNDNFRGR